MAKLSWSLRAAALEYDQPLYKITSAVLNQHTNELPKVGTHAAKSRLSHTYPTKHPKEFDWPYCILIGVFPEKVVRTIEEVEGNLSVAAWLEQELTTTSSKTSRRSFEGDWYIPSRA